MWMHKIHKVYKTSETHIFTKVRLQEDTVLLLC